MNYLKQGKSFYKEYFVLMIPMVFQQFVTNFMSMADTFMVGALGETELAAVTMANSPLFIIQLLIFGIQSGACVLVAQYHGKGNSEAINKVLGIGFYVSCAFSLLVVAVELIAPESVMRVLTNNESLIAPGAEYSRYVCLSYFFSAISGIYIAVQRSMGNTRLGAVVLSGSGLLNIFLNWVMIFGKFGFPMMGVAGAALATTISRVVEVVACVVYAAYDKKFRIKPSLLLRPGRIIARDFVKFALPVVVNEALWSTATSLYTVVMGHMADNTPIIAAYTIAGNLERVLTVCLFASSSAAAIIIGREIGRGNRESVYGKAITLNFLAFLMGVFGTVMVLLVRFFLAEDVIFPLLGISENAVGTALYMLTVISIVLPLRSLNLTNVVGVLRGGGDVYFAMLVDILPIYLVCLPACAVCALVLKMDIRIVYICMFLDDIVKIFACVPRLRSKKWINDVTREVI